tara:strand:+ start:835 stop:1137 length:303 start_codon:yes stop_codon:yes gene_type:complete
MENFTQNLKKYLKPNAVIKFEKIDELQKKQQVLEDHILKVLDLKDLIKDKSWAKECDTKIAKLSKEIVDIEFILTMIDNGKLLVRQYIGNLKEVEYTETK